MSEAVRFLHPKALYLLILVVPFWLARRRHSDQLNRMRRCLTPEARHSHIRHTLSTVLLVALTIILILALAQPQVQRLGVSEVVQKLDVVFVLDTSPSMQAQDIPPTRLDHARQVIKDVLTRQSIIERVGLVSFSASSLILSYLTSDVENVLFYLDYLQSEPMTNLGTNLGAALESGLKVIETSTERNPEHLPKNRKALVLLSDGEDHGGELQKALLEIPSKGIRVYTIGIGSAAGGFVPLGIQNGRMQYLENSNRVRLVSRLNEETLRLIARETGGRFYRSFEGSEIGSALQEILSREREIIGYQRKMQWLDLYRLLISGAAILLGVILLVGRG